MKVLLTLVLMTLSIHCFAQEDSKKEKNFETAKSKYIEHLDNSIKAMQEAKTCASSASSREDLKKCRKEMREKRKAMNKNKREGKKKFQDRRAKRKSKKSSENAED